MRRIIICGLHKYPRGGAFANYIQYFADALIDAGYQIEMLCNINNEYSSQSEFEYRDAHISEIMWQGVGLLKRLMNGKLFSWNLKKKLLTYNLNEGDLLIFPSVMPLTVPIFELKDQYHFKSAGVPLEWFSREQFDNAEEAKQGERLFFLNTWHDIIFPISHLIAEQFPDNKCCIVPIMADIQEYPYIPKKTGKYEFIFPANGMMKDALKEMLQGLAMLSEKELNKIVFHLTGVKETLVYEILELEKIEKIGASLIIHKWMEYTELITLYQHVHYLFLARDISQMTMSNFPSKVPETMTYGIVPVVSRVGDYTKYYLEDGVNSLIFDGCDGIICFNALKRAVAVPFGEYSILSATARKCVEKHFDYRNWSQILKDNIESIF